MNIYNKGFSICVVHVDIEKAKHFYQAAFGFELNPNVPFKTDNKSKNIEMRLDKIVIFLRQWTDIYQERKKYHFINRKHINPPYKKEIVVPVFRDIEKIYFRAEANSAIPIKSPRKNLEGDDYCVLQDYFGYRWVFTQHKNMILNLQESDSEEESF